MDVSLLTGQEPDLNVSINLITWIGYFGSIKFIYIALKLGYKIVIDKDMKLKEKIKASHEPLIYAIISVFIFMVIQFMNYEVLN
jgi:hypothetical protein